MPRNMISKNSTIKKLAAYIKANPNDSFSKFAMALEFLKDEEPQKACIFFEDIYKNDPGYLGVYYHLGKLYERLGRNDAAIKMYKEGVEVAANQQKKRTLKELKEALASLKIEL